MDINNVITPSINSTSEAEMPVVVEPPKVVVYGHPLVHGAFCLHSTLL